MGKKNQDGAPPLNWADIAYVAASLGHELFGSVANMFQRFAVEFATHSAYKDEKAARKRRSQRFAEKAGLEIERMVSGNG